MVSHRGTSGRALTTAGSSRSSGEGTRPFDHAQVGHGWGRAGLRWMQRTDSSSVSPLRLRSEHSLAPRKWPLRSSSGICCIAMPAGLTACEINSVKFL